MPKQFRTDGTQSSAPNKQVLTEIFIRRLAPTARAFLVWDTLQRGLALQVQPTGHKAWKYIYRYNKHSRWYHIGNAGAIGLADARKLAKGLVFQVAQGKDPASERKAKRSQGTFEELAAQYVEEYAKHKN